MLLRRICLLTLWFTLGLVVSQVAAAELKIDLGASKRTWSTAQLLAQKNAQFLTIANDVAFRRSMRYRAIPLSALLKEAGADDQLQFIAADGFAVDIPVKLIFNRKGAVAWLAVEEPDHAWPALPDNKGDAGPFYLVWTHASAAGISTEQWPYKLSAIRRVASIAERFPATAPNASLAADSAVRRGYAVFQRICFACHTLNGEGDTQLGPDLNIPHNPTEYLRDDLLRAYVRDPQSLRRWPQAKMPGFSRATLSDTDLDALLNYLRYMAQHKVKL